MVGVSGSETVGRIALFGSSEGCAQYSVTGDTKRASYLGQPCAPADKRAKQQLLRGQGTTLFIPALCGSLSPHNCDALFRYLCSLVGRSGGLSALATHAVN